jgi:hypothetical protein
MIASVNPFVVTKAEQFNHSYAELASLMHLKPGVADVLLSNSNVFIDGSRGSGKSMYLRLLSLPVKSSYEGLARQGHVEALPSHANYLGIYAKLTPTIFAPHEYEKRPGFADLFQQLFNFYCIEQMIATISEATDSGVLAIPADSKSALTRDLANSILKKASAVGSLSELVDGVRKERRNLRQALNVSPFISDERSQPEALWEAAEIIVRHACPKKERLHLLIDEYDSLSPHQQGLINSYFRKRDYPVTFKIACKKHRLVLVDRDGQPLNPSGDYDRVELDDDDFGLNSTFTSYLEAIANRRLEKSGAAIDIKTLLGSSVKTHRPKTERKYAGFDSVAMLSSGVVRTFLELCRDIYSRADFEDTGKLIPVPAAEQDKVIKFHAANRWSSLARDQSARPELQHLVQQISQLFALRSQNSVEKQVIRLEVLDFNRLPAFVRSILDQALEYEALVQPNRERLQKNRHTASRGYLLHRLLCVHFRLELQSRWDVEISAEQLERLALGSLETVKEVAKEPTRSHSLVEQRSVNTLFSHLQYCPILDENCPATSPVSRLGFLSCRLPEAGKIKDAIRLLKQEFSKANSRQGKFELKTAEDYPPVGDIACKVCGAFAKSEFVLVEFSRLSPSVGMELGLAIARRIPTYILFNKEEQRLVPEPFASLEYHQYSITPSSVEEMVRDRLIPYLGSQSGNHGTVRLGPEPDAHGQDGEGVFIALPGTDYYQETLLPNLRQRLEEAGLAPIITEKEGQALHDLQRAANGIAKSKYCLIDTTEGAPSRAMYLGMAQGYRKRFANLIDVETDSSKGVFTNARSKSTIDYSDSHGLIKGVAEFFNRFGVKV